MVQKPLPETDGELLESLDADKIEELVDELDYADADIAQRAAAAKIDAARFVQEQSVAEMDERIAERINTSKNGDLKFMDGLSYKGVFGVPKPVRKALAEEKRVITKDNPVYMY